METRTAIQSKSCITDIWRGPTAIFGLQICAVQKICCSAIFLFFTFLQYISQGQRDPLKSMRLYNVKVISTDIFGTKRATGDPRVSKRPDFQGLFRFPKKIEFLNCGFQDFWISSFFWISGHIFGTRRATGDPLVSKRPKFLGLY